MCGSCPFCAMPENIRGSAASRVLTVVIVARMLAMDSQISPLRPNIAAATSTCGVNEAARSSRHELDGGKTVQTAGHQDDQETKEHRQRNVDPRPFDLLREGSHEL